MDLVLGRISITTPIRGGGVSHLNNTGVTATVCRREASVPCFTSVTPVIV